MEGWTHETYRQLVTAIHADNSAVAVESLRSHPVVDTAHTIARWLVESIATDTPGSRWLGMAIVDGLSSSYLPGDAALVDRLQHALDGRVPTDLTLIPIDMYILSEILEGGHGDSEGFRLNGATGAILSENPEFIEGVPEPPDWEDDNTWIYLDEIWPREGWRDMADFIDTVDDPVLAERLSNAIRGKGAFRRFGDIVYAADTEQTRWNLFRDERRAGRARHWLAERGLRPD